MQHPNAALIERFYQAFARRDGAAMAACYHAEAHFTDEVFDLRGARVGLMWRMLCERAADLRIEYRAVEGGDAGGSAHWEAWYGFSQTGRQVHNVIEARFEFRDGLILRHVDRFGFHRWASQALGLPGLLLGWTPLLRNKVRATAARGLEQYAARQGGA